jgi:hypothetical protein
MLIMLIQAKNQHAVHDGKSLFCCISTRWKRVVKLCFGIKVQDRWTAELRYQTCVDVRAMSAK